MSTNIQRQPAKRVLGIEFNQATHIYQEEDREKAPFYQLLPTGVRAGRVALCGTLTEIENIGSDSDYFQGRVVVGEEPVYVYAGDYQKEPMSTLQEFARDSDDATVPEYVTVIGKARTYETDDGDTLVQVKRPESIQIVDSETKSRWLLEAANQTLDRIDALQNDEAPYGPLAREVYDVDLEDIRQSVEAALASEAGLPDVEENNSDE